MILSGEGKELEVIPLSSRPETTGMACSGFQFQDSAMVVVVLVVRS
jgi:hypothetical protein